MVPLAELTPPSCRRSQTQGRGFNFGELDASRLAALWQEFPSPVRRHPLTSISRAALVDHDRGGSDSAPMSTKLDVVLVVVWRDVVAEVPPALEAELAIDGRLLR